VQTGDEVPDFELAADGGQQIRLYEELRQGPVVLFFYPKAMTSGCTAESCHFRDLAAEFAAVGARRLGISADSVERQRQFAAKHNFDYPPTTACWPASTASSTWTSTPTRPWPSSAPSRRAAAPAARAEPPP
jgi:peroxiredoxin